MTNTVEVPGVGPFRDHDDHVGLGDQEVLVRVTPRGRREPLRGLRPKRPTGHTIPVGNGNKEIGGSST